MNRIFPVTFNGDTISPGSTGEHIIFVAFDREAAQKFADRENNECQCEILTVDEVALIDNYGFHCERSETAVVAPWIAKVSDRAAAHYAPEAWNRYVREMSMGG